MEHEHHHHEVSGKRLWWTILLNLGITIAEGIGGLISGSISLVSDAIHNFSDVLSLLISYFANRLSKRDANEKQTFGYKRSEIIAAFFNASTLIILAIYILYEAINRMFAPEIVDSTLVIWLALGSIVVNGLSVIFIKEGSKDNMNIKSAYLHLLGDMMTSIAVLAGGILMKYFAIYWIDPVFSILIALYLIYMSWDIFKSSLKIMMQFTPDNIDIDAIANEVSSWKEVNNMHHIHIWQINEHDIMFEAHLDVQQDMSISEFDAVLSRIKTLLHDQYEIKHVTIQPENALCGDTNIIHN